MEIQEDSEEWNVRQGGCEANNGMRNQQGRANRTDDDDCKWEKGGPPIERNARNSIVEFDGVGDGMPVGNSIKKREAAQAFRKIKKNKFLEWIETETIRSPVHSIAAPPLI